MPELSFFSVTQKLALLDWGKDRLSLDLRDVTFVRPFVVIYLGMLLRYYNSRGKHFSLELPEDPKVRGYLSRHNFYERFNFNPEVITEENLRRIEKSTSLNDILDLSPDRYLGDEVAERVFQLLSDNNISLDNGAVAEHIAEVVDNFALHSGERLGSFLVQYFPNERYFRVAIGDTGMGFRQSLSQNPEFRHMREWDSWKVISEAYKPLVSRRSSAGTGLSDLQDYLIQTEGYLHCSSEDGYYTIQRGKASMGRLPFSLPGVQMEFGFPER